jgi:hypothetical protein
LDPGADSSNSSALDVLASHLREHHGSAINTILYYGSCLRSNDPFSGIVDLHLIVDNYSDVYPGKLAAFVNWMLPPNVFYKELPIAGRTLRVKYNVLSSRALRRGLSRRRLHPYFWGRFSQPMEILWSRDEAARLDVDECLQLATRTFLECVLPNVAASGTVRNLWQQGLRMSYSTELRSEGPGRAGELVEHALDYYVSATRAAASTLRYPLQISGAGETSRYTATNPKPGRVASRWIWALRRVHGKFLSVARLIKSLLTFDGGLDYAAWKLGRHSGQVVEIPDRVRRHPLIFVWPLLWKLYRRGIIR